MLAYLGSNETRTENHWNNFNKEIPEPTQLSNAKPLSEIIRNLILKGGGCGFYCIESFYWDNDLDVIREDILCECLIPDGWDQPLTDSDQLNISILRSGGSATAREFDIEVILYQ